MARIRTDITGNPAYKTKFLPRHFSKSFYFVLKNCKLEKNILDDYEPVPAPCSPLFIPLLILQLLFTGFLILDMFFEIETFSVKAIDIDAWDIVFGLLIPGTGLSLFAARKKAGWFIAATFISLLAAACLVSAADSTTINGEGFNPLLLTGRHAFILAVSISSAVMFQTRSIRNSFRVSKLLWFSSVALWLGFIIYLVVIGDL